jgi:hypothetical protein
VCHSEEPCDEESAFYFPIEKTGKAQSRCFISFSMTQQQTPTAPKDSFSLGGLCVLAGDIPFLFLAAVSR